MAVAAKLSLQEAHDGRNNLAEEHERQTEHLQAAFERLYKCAIKTRPPPSRPVNVGSESGWIAYYADNRQWFECVPDGLFDNKFLARFLSHEIRWELLDYCVWEHSGWWA